MSLFFEWKTTVKRNSLKRDVNQNKEVEMIWWERERKRVKILDFGPWFFQRQDQATFSLFILFVVFIWFLSCPSKGFFLFCVLCLFLFFDDNDDVEVSLSDACWFECGLDVLLSFLCAFVLSLSKPFCFDSWSSFLCNTSCREETGEKGEIECPVRVKLE